MKPTLCILAAGMGSRYGSLKQVEAFGPSGETIIDYSVYDAKRAGFGKIVFVIRESIEKEFKEVFGDKFSKYIDVEFVFQELHNIPGGHKISPERVKPWGTAHAVWVAKDVINEPFGVINADDFYGRDAFIRLGAYLSAVSPGNTSNYCMVGFELKKTLSDFGSVNRGECVTDENGFLISVTERLKIRRNESGVVEYPGEDGEMIPLSEDTPVSMNMWGCLPNIFDEFQQRFERFLEERGQELKSEFYIPTLISQLIDEKKIFLKMIKTDSPWFGVTYKEDKPMVIESLQKLVDQGVYPPSLWE
ncbi:MAG: sugar phosphate nucleotidyltransferase [Bacteroidota bacterium]